jgi:hypothetical protein
MKNIFIAAFIFLMSSLTYAQTDTAIANDSQWNYGHAGTDRDLDGGGQWKSDGKSTNGHIGDDGQWNLNLGGTERNLNNDGQWDASRVAPIDFSIVIVSGIPTMMVKIGI